MASPDTGFGPCLYPAFPMHQCYWTGMNWRQQVYEWLQPGLEGLHFAAWNFDAQTHSWRTCWGQMLVSGVIFACNARVSGTEYQLSVDMQLQRWYFQTNILVLQKRKDMQQSH